MSYKFENTGLWLQEKIGYNITNNRMTQKQQNDTEIKQSVGV